MASVINMSSEMNSIIDNNNSGAHAHKCAFCLCGAHPWDGHYNWLCKRVRNPQGWQYKQSEHPGFRVYLVRGEGKKPRGTKSYARGQIGPNAVIYFVNFGEFPEVECTMLSSWRKDRNVSFELIHMPVLTIVSCQFIKNTFRQRGWPHKINSFSNYYEEHVRKAWYIRELRSDTDADECCGFCMLNKEEIINDSYSLKNAKKTTVPSHCPWLPPQQLKQRLPKRRKLQPPPQQRFLMQNEYDPARMLCGGPGYLQQQQIAVTSVIDCDTEMVDCTIDKIKCDDDPMVGLMDQRWDPIMPPLRRTPSFERLVNGDPSAGIAALFARRYSGSCLTRLGSLRTSLGLSPQSSGSVNALSDDEDDSDDDEEYVRRIYHSV